MEPADVKTFTGKRTALFLGPWGVALLTLALGCSPDKSSTISQSQLNAQQSQQVANELFNNAIEVLGEVSDTSPQIVLDQVVSRLQQWLATKEPLDNWQPDPLVATLPEPLQQTAPVKGLAALRFTFEDGERLREAVWLRHISRKAVGATTDDLARATLLFDWTVRNIQLFDDSRSQTAKLPHMLWETLLLGEGTALDRAWIFMLLARQEGLDVVLLTPTGQKSPEIDTPGHPLAALLLGTELYLFDPQYGLPVPGPDGQGVATLAQAADDASVLKQMDVEGVKYPLTAADLQSVTAWIEASPFYLSQRMRIVEQQLTAAHRMIMSIDATDLAERLRKCPHVSDVQIWLQPYQRLAAFESLDKRGRDAIRRELQPFSILGPDMWEGRVLHLLGQYTGEQNAVQFYQACRPSDAMIGRLVINPYTHQEEELNLAEDQLRLRKQVGILAKQNASYWLGLVAMERGNYDTAVDFFAKRTLEAAPGGPWTEGALYNLGRSYEAQDKKDAAVKAYRATQGPQRPGNLLRAKRLEKN